MMQVLEHDLSLFDLASDELQDDFDLCLLSFSVSQEHAEECFGGPRYEEEAESLALKC